MPKLINIIAPTLLLASSISLADVPSSCDDITYEQRDVLDKAYAIGYLTGYQLTLPAIAAHESFIGDRIVRIRPYDGIGSYGVTHILLTTAGWMHQLSNQPHILLADEATRLITNDGYALESAVRYLQIIDVYGKNKTKAQWHSLWNRYNGNSTTYSQHIADWINFINDCEFYKYWEL